MKGFTAPPPRRPRGAARHLRRPRLRARHPPPARARRHRRRALPVHEIADEPAIVARGLKNYWGYSTLGFFAPAGALRLGRAPRAAGQRVQGDGQGPPRAGIEVILDVVYNHTCEGDRARARPLSLRGIDNRSYYRLDPAIPAYYVDYTGCGNTLNVRHPADAQADHGQPALLGDGDARRRLPLRPRLHAGARPPRRRQALRASSTSSTRTRSSPGSSSSPSRGTSARAATRSATSPSSGRSGTGATATPSAASGAATRASPADLGYRLTGSSDLYENGGRRPHASINFVTAHDGFTLHDLVSLRAQAQRGERREQPRRQRRQRRLQLRRRGRDRRCRRSTRSAPARCATSSTTLILSQGVPMLARRRRDRPHAAGEQQRLLPGQRDRLASTGTSTSARARPARVHAAAHRAEATPSPSSGGRSSSPAATSAAASSRTSCGSPPPAPR